MAWNVWILFLCAVCSPTLAQDYDVSAFSEVGGPVAFDDVSAVTMSYSITMQNGGVTIGTGTTNFVVEYCFEDKDLGASGAAGIILCAPAALSTDVSATAPFLANAAYTIVGSQALTVPAASCAQITNLCVRVLPTGTSPAVAETTTDKNYKCIDVSSRVSCAVALSVTAATGVPDATTALVGPFGRTGAAISLTITNTAGTSGQGNDINAVVSPYSNYIFTAQFYDSTTTTLKGSVFYPSFSASDLRQGLAGASATLTVTGTIDYPVLSSADCNSVDQIQFSVQADSSNGASFRLSAAATVLNQAIEITCYPDPKPVMTPADLTSAVPALPMAAGSTVTLTFNMNVNNPNSGTNDIILAETDPDTNYILQAQFTDQDLSTGASDTLGLPKVFASTYPGTVQKDALGAGATVTWTGVTAVMVMDDAKCPFVKYLCVFLMKGSTPYYADSSTLTSSTNLAPNTSCIALTAAQKECTQDVSVEEFTDPDLTVFTPGTAITMPFSMRVHNNDPETDIGASTTGNNFDITFRLSDVDLRAADLTTNSLNALPAITGPTLTPTTIPKTALPKLTSLSFTGTVSINIAVANCPNVLYICANSMPSGTDSYKETTTLTKNNWMCYDVRKRVSCGVDLEITAFTPDPTGTVSPLIGALGRSGLTGTITLTNSAGTAGQGYDVASVASPYKNYLFKLMYSSSTTCTTVGSVFYMTLADSDLRQGLADGATVTITGTYDLPAFATNGNCGSATNLCIKVEPDTVNKATWAELAADQANNCHCLALVRNCEPDPKPTNLLLQTGTLTGGSWNAITFSVDVNNVATGAGDALSAVSGTTTHFTVQLQLSDANIGTGGTDSLGLGKVPTSFPDIGELQATVPNSGTVTLGTAGKRGTASVQLTDIQCSSAQFLCAFLYPGNNPGYRDQSAVLDPINEANNATCVDITASKSCPIDVDATGLSISQPSLYQIGNAGIVGQITLKNTHPSQDIAVTTGTDENFHIKIQLSSVNLRAVATGNTIATAATDVAINANSMAGLVSGSSFTFGISESVAISAADCPKLKFICIQTTTTGTPGFTAKTGGVYDLNDYHCQDVSSSVFCGVDVQINSATNSPAELNGLSAKTLTVGLKIRNIGNGANSYDNIAAVTGANRNFAFRAQFSDNDWPGGTADTLGLAPFYPTIATADLQQALTGVGATGTLTDVFGVYTFPVIPAAQCNSVAYICYTVVEGSGASYAEASTQKVNNDFCQAVSVSCYPDPKPTGLTVAATPVITDGTTAITFTLVITNQNTGDNDVISTSVAPVTNWRIKLQPTDADMSTSPDTLGIASVDTVIPVSAGADVYAALAKGPGTVTLGPTSTGTANVYIPRDKCSQVNRLCAIMYRGSTDGYTDASAASDNTNLMPNTTCTAVTPTCSVDMDLSSLTFDPVNIPAGTATTVHYTIQLTNLETTHAAPAATGAGVNFNLAIDISDADIRVSPGANSLTALNPTIGYDSTTINKNTVSPSGTLTITGDFDITISTAVCPNVIYFCATSTPVPGTGTAYTEYDMTNNRRCTDIRPNLSCGKDMQLVSWVNIADHIVGNLGKTITVDMDVQNVGSGSANDIVAVTGTNKNLKVTAGYYSGTCTGAVTLLGTEVEATFSDADLQQAFNAVGTGGAPTNMVGSVTLPPITGADCTNTACWCVSVAAGIGASFIDSVTTNNRKCNTASMSCAPNPVPASLAVNPTPAQPFVGGQTGTVTFQFDVTNANSGANDKIYAITAPDFNFDFVLQLSDVNMNTGTDTLGLGTITPTIAAADRRQAVGAGATINLAATYSGSALITMPPAVQCTQIQFLCIIMTIPTAAEYQDANLVTDPSDQAGNTNCQNINTKKICGEDVDVYDIDEPGNVILPSGTATTVSFTIDLRNNIPRDIAAVTAPEENFGITVRLSDVDIRAAGVGSDSLGFTAVTATITPAGSTRTALLSGNSLTLSGSASVTVSTTPADCQKTRYFCVNSSPSANAYDESTTATDNNWHCKDVSTQVQCGVDVRLTSWTAVPGTMSASTPVTMNMDIDITNAGTAGVDDIPKVNNPDRNFKLTAFYSSTDAPSTTQQGASWTPAGDAGDLRRKLDVGDTKRIDGTITFPAIDSSICANVAFACITVEADTTNNAAYTETGTLADNTKCNAITVSCFPDPKPLNLDLTPTTAVPKFTTDTSNAITFNINFNNAATAGSNDDITATTGAKTNFDVKLRLSDVDLSVSTADTLGQPFVDTTIAKADRQQALAAAATVTVSGATANVFLPDSACATAKYLCAILYRGNNPDYTDLTTVSNPTDLRPNTTCVDISAMKLCHIDVEMTSLSEPANDAILIGQTTTLTFSLGLTNNDPNEDIGLVTAGGQDNFQITFVVSDVDIRNTGVASNSLTVGMGFTAPTVTVTPAADTKQGLVAGGAITLGGTVGIVIPNSADCVKARYICANSMPNGATAYTEMATETLNNYYCKNIENQMSCGIDVEAVSFTWSPTAADGLIGPLGRSGETFSVDIRNIGTAGAGNDIQAVTGTKENYLFELYYTTAAGAAPVGAKFYPTVATADKQFGLAGVGAGGAVTTVTGTVDYPTVTSCNTITVVCLKVLPGTGAEWNEPAGTLANNEKCNTINTALTCTPDPKPANLAVTAGTFQSGNTNTITFSIDIANQNSGTLDQILAESYPNTNYEIRLQLSDVDMTSGTDTLGLSQVVATVAIADLRSALASGATKSITGATAPMLTPDNSCSSITNLCAYLYPGINSKYLDASAAADPLTLATNMTCLTITPECHQDVEVVTISEPNNTPMPIFVATAVDFDVTLRNNEALRDIPGQTGAGTENYHLKFVLSNTDIRVSGVGSNSLTPTPTFENTDVAVSPAGDVQLALLAGQSITLSGTVTVTVPNVPATCAAIRYLCVQSMPKTTEYDEDPSRLTNNWGCKDVRNQISCTIDVMIDSWALLPDNTDPMIGVLGRSSVTLNAALRNQATAGAGNNIAAVSGSNKNFVFTAYYCDGTATTCTKIGVDFTATPTISDAQLQQGLTAVGTAGATTTFTGTIDYPTLTLATTSCNAVRAVCLTVGADTLNGAIYAEAASQLGDNTLCNAISITCSPEVKPDLLTTGTNINVDTLNTITFNMYINNTAATGFATTNDVFAAVNPDSNYDIWLKFSDVDMSTSSDSLGLPLTKASVDPAELRQGIVAGGDVQIGTTAATVDLNLPSAQCQSVRFLCAIVFAGTNPDYIDSSAYANPNDLKPNTTCVSILGRKQCNPDPSVTAFTIARTADPTPLQFVYDQWLKVDISFTIDNVATGSRSDIAAVTAPNKNFDLYFLFTDTDLVHGPSAINSTFFTFISTGANDYDALPQGGSLSFTGTMLMVMKPTICNDLRYGCVYFKHLNYNDANHRNNLKCMDVNLIKTCKPDVNVDAFTPSGGQTLIDAAANTYTFDLTISNVADAISGNDILAPPTSPAGSHNYKFQIQLTDADLGAGGTDTVGRTRDDVTTQQDDTLVAQDAPVSKTGVSLSLSIPAPSVPVAANDECTKIKYACLWVNYGDNARWVDADLTNNVKCSEIHAANVKNCRPVINNLPAVAYLNAENATVGTNMDLYTVNATQGDNNVPAAIQYSKTSGDARFSINAATGVVSVSVTTQFDYETTNTYLLEITVTDTTANAAYTSSATLTISIIDSNDTPTITNVPAAAGATPTINEITPTSVYQVLFTDQDLPAQTMIWSIDVVPVHATPAPFWIDANGIISVSSPGLNFEAIAPPTYSVTVHLTDSGIPAKTATPQELIVVMADVAEELTIHNLPATVYVREDDVSTAAQTIFTVNATDPDAAPATLTYVMSVSPVDGNFQQQSGSPENIQLVANPSLNYEKAPEYKIAIMVKDGTTTPKIGILTVKVVNYTYGETPSIDSPSPWPGSITIPETQTEKALVFSMKASDQDGRLIEYSILGSSPVSGNGKFQISQSGDLFVVANPGFDADTVSSYTLTLKVCAVGILTNCTTQNLLVNIGFENEPPYWTPTSLNLYVTEGSNLPTVPATASDPDAGQTLSYSVVTSKFSEWFTIDASTGVITKNATKAFDYEATSQSSTMIVSFKVTDDGTPDPLSGYFNMTVYILNKADQYPTFQPTNQYSISVSEDAAVDTSVLLFSVTDWDLPPYGNPNATVPMLAGGPAANNYSDLHFKTHRLLGGTVNEHKYELRVQSAWDRESITVNPFLFLMVVEDDAGLQNTATVTCTILNVNDNRPTFNPNFYNFEVMYNDSATTLVGTVTATDNDVEYNTISYELLEDASGAFSLGSSSGELKTAVTPLQQNHKYLLYTVAKDNHPGNIDVSVVTVIRVDTYVDCEVLTNWTTGQPLSYFTDANKQAFLTDISALCTPCRANAYQWISDASGNAVALVYFLENTITDSVDNVGQAKVFIKATTILSAYTSDNTQSPANSITGSAALAVYGISKITYYKSCGVPFNWFLDTVEGGLFIGLCMSAIFTGIMTAVICAAKQFGTTAGNQMKDMALASSSSSWKAAPDNFEPPSRKPGTTKRVVTPPTKTPPSRPPTQKLNNSRPPTTASVSGVELEEDRAPSSRGPFKKHNQVPHDYGGEANRPRLKSSGFHPSSAGDDFNGLW